VNGFHKFNYSDIISNEAGNSSARGCSVALFRERGSLRAAANRKPGNPQSRRKAAVNALEGLELDCAIPNLHPRKAAQRVVKVGPPRRCTVLSEVVAIGRSCFLTEAYAGGTYRTRPRAEWKPRHLFEVARSRVIPSEAAVTLLSQ
jgi:hypothetical protein